MVNLREHFEVPFSMHWILDLQKYSVHVLELKPVQEETLLYFVKWEDVFAVLPTGCRKSLIFQLVSEHLHVHGQGFGHPKAAILVVVCPLTLSPLIDFHIQELKDHGIHVTACSLTDQDIPVCAINNISPNLYFRLIFDLFPDLFQIDLQKKKTCYNNYYSMSPVAMLFFSAEKEPALKPEMMVNTEGVKILEQNFRSNHVVE